LRKIYLPVCISEPDYFAVENRSIFAFNKTGFVKSEHGSFGLNFFNGTFRSWFSANLTSTSDKSRPGFSFSIKNV
jgi:hypothetical protein